MGCTGSKAMLKDDRVKQYNELKEAPQIKEKEKEEQPIKQTVDQNKIQATPIKQKEKNKELEIKETEPAKKDKKRVSFPPKYGEFEDEKVHKDESKPVKENPKPTINESPIKNENKSKVDEKPTKSEKKENNDEKPAHNEIKLENVLTSNINISNKNSPTKMHKSITQEKIINTVKSEVYDEILKCALNEINITIEDFK